MTARARGRFVVLEGGDACGKTTQVGVLAGRLRERGVDVVETFEPGGTRLGARLREMLLAGAAPVAPAAEALLMAADRAQHVAEVVEPALARGAWVVSDRFVPSSLAYQGVGRGLGVDEVDALSRFATRGLAPDLVVVLDLADDVARVRLPTDPDRLEREHGSFHDDVRAAYRSLAGARGWVVVDAGGSTADVGAAIWSVVERRLAR